MERKDGRLNYEKALAEFSAREKAGARELMVLKDELGSREVELDRFKSQAEELGKTASRLEEQIRREDEADSAPRRGREERIQSLEIENTGLRKLGQEYERSKAIMEQLKEKLRTWKSQ